MGSVPPGLGDLPKPWIETPCLYSSALSKTAGCNIYLKLENLQPSGSFKSRGVGNLMVRAVAKARSEAGAGADVHFYCSSGGNAGLACATAARDLGYPATIVVPMSTSQYMVDKLRALGADVRQYGANWAAADQHLRSVVMAEPRRPGSTGENGGSRGPAHAVYVPPFDHPDIWDGAASLVDEVAAQLAPQRVHPDAFVCSVGGGGLLCGLMAGIDRVYGAGQAAPSACSPATSPVDGAPPIPKVLAVETRGADSLAASVAAGQLVTLPGISSIATSLGCVRVAERTFAWAHERPEAVVPLVVDDADAVDAIVRFLDDMRLLVEPACGAALAPLYTTAGTGRVNLLRQSLGAGKSDAEWADHNVVVIVCGGSGISLDILAASGNNLECSMGWSTAFLFSFFPYRGPRP